MDILKTFRFVPDELLTLQKELDLNPAQFWYIHVWARLGYTRDLEIANHTGVPRSTIRDIRKSLEAKGYMTDKEGMKPLADLLLFRRTLHPSQNPVNDLFDRLTSSEKIFVLDDFSCRICFKPWDAFTYFKMTKIVDKEDVFKSRVTLCPHCFDLTTEGENLIRLQQYLRLRWKRQLDRADTFLTDMEQDRVTQLREKKAKNGVTVSATPLQKQPEQNEVAVSATPFLKPEEAGKGENNGLAERFPLTTPPNLLNTPVQHREEKKSASSPSGEDTVVSPDGSTSESLEKLTVSARGISVDQDEEVESLVSADQPQPGTHRRGTPMNAKSQAAKERYLKAVADLDTKPEDEWTTNDLSIYINESRRKKFKCGSSRETIGEMNKRSNAINNACETVSKSKKFVDWTMDNWHRFWFAQADAAPSYRDIAGHLDELLSSFDSGGKIEAHSQDVNATRPRHLDELPDMSSEKTVEMTDEQKKKIEEMRARL